MSYSLNKNKPVLLFLLVRGGINDVYRKCWQKTSSEDLFFYDMISAYAFAAMFWLPIGKYEVIKFNFYGFFIFQCLFFRFLSVQIAISTFLKIP